MAKLDYKLTRDTLFKIFFVLHQDLLKSLVSQVLGIEVDAITRFEITNPDISPKELGGKRCVLDIAMKVNKKLVNLEVQVEDKKDYPARTLFYWARCYSSALLEGNKNYNALPPTVAINIVDFVLFDDTEDVHSEFRALEVKRHTELTDKMVLHYFELKKLPEVTESDAGNALKLWLALFHAETDEEMEEIAKIGGKTMEQAVMAYRDVVKSERFRDAERRRERARLDEIADLYNAKLDGIAEAKAEIVLNMHKKGRSIADIMDVTDLPEKDVYEILKTK